MQDFKIKEVIFISNRKVQKHIWFSTEEAQILKHKAGLAGISETELIRMLVKGYKPREKPDDRFYAFTDTLNEISSSLVQLIANGKCAGKNTKELEQAVESLTEFQKKITLRFTCPEKSTFKWQ